MTFGFEILYHKSIPDQDAVWLKEWLTKKVKEHFWTESSYKTGQRSHRFYSRGILGLQISNGEVRTNYYFRRLVRNRRIFGIVPLDSLVDKNGETVTNDKCMCTLHDGGKRVNLREGFNYEDFHFFCRIGEIKG